MSNGTQRMPRSMRSRGKAAEGEPSKPAKPPRSRARSLTEIAVIVAIAAGLAFLVQEFIVKPYKIPSGSMEPTLAIGQRVLVDRIGMDFGGPEVGDIVVFHPPKAAKGEESDRNEPPECGSVPAPPHFVAYGQAACSRVIPEEDTTVNFIKRVVAGPGEWLYVKEGHVYRAKSKAGPFKREPDSYITPCGASRECNFLTPIKIPAGHWFMMGDNRGNSDDSRFWGPVPTEWIIGVAFATYWPPERIGFF